MKRSMYSTFVAYLLWFLSGFGAMGFHRFYLGKIPSGLLWMFTGGLLGVGGFYDLITLPGQVREANIRNALFSREQAQVRHEGPVPGESWRYASDGKYRVVNGKGRDKESIEHIILRIARENKGILSVSEVALNAHISMDEAKKCLDTLVSKGFAELRVRKSGTLVYVIPDMADKDEALEDL